MMRIEVLGTGCPKCRKLTDKDRAKGKAASTKEAIAAVEEAADMILNPEKYGGDPFGE